MAAFLVPCVYECLLLRSKGLKRIDLERVSGEVSEYKVLRGSAFLYEDDELVGFAVEELPPRLRKMIVVADAEFRTDRVPKLDMERVESVNGSYIRTKQYSTIAGTLPPKPHLRRRYLTRSSLHRTPSSRVFVKAMLLASGELLKLLKQHSEELHQRHMDEVHSAIPERWRFGDGYTSTISNYNISAPVRQDHANVKGTLNSIVCKRNQAAGGNLFLPEYGISFDQPDGSVLFYPAWRNKHGVTPIEATRSNGYRNSHIWYAIRVNSADEYDQHIANTTQGKGLSGI